MKRIGVISDTHSTFDETLRHFLRDVDEIWHAGDFGSIEMADQIAAYKPTRGVFGNIDGGVMRRSYREFEFFECEGKRVLMTHIGGYPNHYSPAAKRMIEECRPDIFIAGHSHILKVMPDRKYNLLHINPGAAGRQGFHKVSTLVRFTIDGKTPKDLEVLEIKKN